ncbi:putative oxidoreductase of aldo/keto reductase family [uncultured delta proteobacterium]|uniref:Putative oxidoreductase of aldo/keto reductase family n=1 Tax=uncultured delta proteobacterium TaxID=34034 RepID=A0A212K2A2_9DELT|nr:putative oxidoreductase of aldo/keto reductase family [uncultured delta proteobacterium]
MRYTPFGKTGESVSVLGLGCGRLPVSAGKGKAADSRAVSLIRHAVDSGVNVLDCGFPYRGAAPDQERIEALAGNALKDGYRDKVFLTAQLPAWRELSRCGMEAHLDGQLKRLAVDAVDFYCIGNIQRADWRALQENDLASFLEKALQDGKIRHAGFSACDAPGLFREILAYRDWAFCQQAYNYYAPRFQAGKAGIALAASRGLGVAATSPLLGGLLADALPEDVLRVFEETGQGLPPAAWALRWVWDDPGVSLAVCAMRSVAEVDANCRLAAEAAPGNLSDAEREIFRRARRLLKAKGPVPCTECHQCSCPAGVEIPAVLAAYNAAAAFGEPCPSHAYAELSPDKRASQCTGCGMCEPLCPEGIRIRIQVARAADFFGDKR